MNVSDLPVVPAGEFASKYGESGQLWGVRGSKPQVVTASSPADTVLLTHAAAGALGSRAGTLELALQGLRRPGCLAWGG